MKHHDSPVTRLALGHLESLAPEDLQHVDAGGYISADTSDAARKPPITATTNVVIGQGPTPIIPSPNIVIVFNTSQH